MSTATTSQSTAPPAAPVADKSKTKHEPAELPAVLESIVEDGKTSAKSKTPAVKAPTELVKDRGPRVDTTVFPPAQSKAPAVKAPAPVMAEPVMYRIRLELIAPSKTNPRKKFDGPAFDDLVASVKAHGVIVPVLVRPVIRNDYGRYELVAGERRFRASKAAGLVDIPAIVRELSDREALELQIVENLQREDVTALEEAEGYVVLVASILANATPPFGRQEAIEEIAAKVGKSTRYIYARMKLTELAPEVKTAIASGKLPVSHADVIATYPVEKQKKRLADAFAWGADDNSGKYVSDGRVLSFREFKDVVARHDQQETDRKARQQKQRADKKAGKSKAAIEAAARGRREAEERKREQERERQEFSSLAVFQSIVGKVKDISGAVLEMLIEQQFDSGDLGDERHIAELFGWPIPVPVEQARYGWLQKQYEARRAKLTAEQKAKLYVAMRTCIDVEWGEKQLDEAAKWLKLDPKKIRTAAVAKLKAADAAEVEVVQAKPAKKTAKGKAAGKRGCK